MPAALPRIFVSIASYRDTECQWTVKDLFEKAAHPDRVFVGICWQFIRDEDADCFQVRTRPDQVRVIEVDARESQGVCWARAQIQSLWQGEEYYFQIDAHSRFAKGWDEMLIDSLRRCPTPRAVLSTYPASYTPPDKLGKDIVALINAKEFDERGILMLGSKGVAPADIPSPRQPVAFIGAGEVFGPSAIVKDVPYDPFIYFIGEEITLAVRLWTHGWDIYPPDVCAVYHEYSERPNKRRHWHDHKKWTELSERAAVRIRHLLGTEPAANALALQQLDRFGLGSARPLEAYERFSGVDFRRRLINGKSQEQLEAELRPEAMRERIVSRFTDIWRTNGWGSSETRSGPGSTLAQTEQLRALLPGLFQDQGVRRLVDAGCGDLNWITHVSETLELYLGFDVVPGLVTDAQRRIEARKTHFAKTADITRDILPKADLILCRDVLTHLPHDLVLDALAAFRKSGTRLLLATTFARGANDPVRLGGWQPIDLCAPPFNLGEPLLRLSEGLPQSSKALGLWRLDPA